ncbi:unnamed protein product [Zymoseptoria tritici ST99CH_3D7]|uniref:type I protein arginine methyltransferase n=1 Tax=Zymoseptoria tritici (strain ST99CH_3D7) TaxID=1276538 RepID=A0A1X7REC8_ZYMT9|nr:unnamed protein product [Zymoseptoria tritici ST99CH_3D7]
MNSKQNERPNGNAGMPELPHGWRLRNSAGEVVGPPVEDDYSGSDSGSDDPEGFNIRPDSEGWNDVEDDSEPVSIKCLLCDDVFADVKVTMEHCKAAHEFDFVDLQKAKKLDFYSSIKLVNYIRSEVLAGKAKPDVQDPLAWADDKFLQPTLPDDALLFSLDELDESPLSDEEEVSSKAD